MKNIGFSPRVVYDGGAFIGKWAKETADIFPTAQLVIIEPNTSVFPELNKNIEHFGDRAVLIKAAVAEVEGKGELNVWENPSHKNKITALAASSLLSHFQGDPSQKIKVEIKTLDGIMEETGLKPDLVKLDLQGGEIKD